jgi:hypothetical protein
MKDVVRGGLALVASVATFYFFGWMGSALLSALVPGKFPFTFGLAFLLSALLSVVVGRQVWVGSAALVGGRAPGLLGSIVTGAAVVGGIGFVAGFFGPLLIAPGANQGPLLGLFFTGPLGIVAGAIGGAVYALSRRNAG